MKSIDFKVSTWWMEAANLVAAQTDFQIVNFEGSNEFRYLADLIQDRDVLLHFEPEKRLVTVRTRRTEETEMFRRYGHLVKPQQG